ncbi:MAG TPA: CvpA family protein [Candidatus Blautia faecavium]|uniref:CvpA family protein n=1 Tax=Candidatus Blautia faecavium TaxID=2838487 RepID=A0A9D2LT57_9FIRM|nr:CvpA family protein [Candidatus Blautia faecavium]
MTWTWLGLAVLAFLALACFAGYKRGFVKEVVSTFFVLLAIAAAWLINPYVNDFLRENTSVYETVQEGCQELVNTETGGAKNLGETEQESLIEGLTLPGFVKSSIEENNTSEVYQYLAVNTFTEYVSEYLAQSVVNGIAFVVSFLLATILIRVITYALDLISKLPLINGVNKIAGAVLGIVKAVLFVWIAFLILTILCNTEVGKAGLELIERDPLLSFLYDTDIFVRIFMSIF